MKRPRWVNDGDTVWIPWPKGGPAHLLCLVVVAAGNLVRVVNELHRVDKWFRIENLLVPADDPRADRD